MGQKNVTLFDFNSCTVIIIISRKNGNSKFDIMLSPYCE